MLSLALSLKDKSMYPLEFCEMIKSFLSNPAPSLRILLPP